MKFAKGLEQNYYEEMFRIVKVIRNTPWPEYEQKNMTAALIEGQFYGEELTPVCVTKRSVYKTKYQTNVIETALSNISFT